MDSPELDQLVDRPGQVPCFYVPDVRGHERVPVYEVWLWHRELKRWFCMSTRPDPALERHGVVYFWPGDVAGLYRQIRALGGVPRGQPVGRVA